MDAKGVVVLEDVVFEDLLSEAANAPDDRAAQIALTSHLQEVLDTGDLERVIAVAMIVGATACMHPHLEGAAHLFSDLGMNDDDHEGDGHDHVSYTGHRTHVFWLGSVAAVPNKVTIRDLINKVFAL
ncbi:MAG TPA: hypothetical protein VGO07_03490 [Candidatus Saccharimonadales bacterium]|jgi:hypothetical protein|nr:hypothetical protein [Candidatus Saccharimonadales bacterium]